MAEGSVNKEQATTGRKFPRSLGSRVLIFILFTCMALTACNGQAAVQPTATVPPASTATLVPSPTFTSFPTTSPTASPTAMPTLDPTETPIPRPASLTATISLSGDPAKPFVSAVELRNKDTFHLVGKSVTSANGVYKIEKIDPGSYELWVLITPKTQMLPGCADVAFPDNTWKLGIKFGGDKALTMEDANLSKGLLLAQNLQSSDLTAEGFFAVLEDFKIESGMENKLDVTLLCK